MERLTISKRGNFVTAGPTCGVTEDDEPNVDEFHNLRIIRYNNTFEQLQQASFDIALKFEICISVQPKEQPKDEGGLWSRIRYYVLAGVAVVIVVTILLVIYCCCCRSRRKSNAAVQLENRGTATSAQSTGTGNYGTFEPMDAEDGSAFPEHWDQQSDPLEIFDMEPGTGEFTKVAEDFRSTIKKGFTELKIRRIQNTEEYQIYSQKRRHMKNYPGMPAEYEKKMWHGTKVDVVNKIYKKGFNRSHTGKGGGDALGKGTYFAYGTSLANGYAHPNIGGRRVMLYCSVLCGRQCEGHHTYVEAPEDYESCHEVQYDEGEMKKVCVVYRDHQAYPDYEVTYKITRNPIV